jgi:hypothetical protein
MADSDEIPHPKRLRQIAFLAAYRRTGVVTRAAAAVGIARETHYDWLEEEGYREEFRAATIEAGAVLEETAIQRAVDGWEEPVYHDGKVVGTIRKYSDTLLIFALKGAMPHKYRERATIEHDASPVIKRLIGISEDEI